MTKGTFDAYLWGIVETKQRFISQIMTSKELARDCEDVDETVLNFAEIKAVASGNPLIMEKMEVDNEVTRLRVLKSGYESKRYLLQDAFTLVYPKKVEKERISLERYEKDIQMRNVEMEKKPMFEIAIKGKYFTKHKEAGEFLRAVVEQGPAQQEQKVGVYKGFSISYEKKYDETILYIRGCESCYKIEMKSSDTGNMVRLENLINNLDVDAAASRRLITEYVTEIENAKSEYEKPFPYEDLLKEKLRRQLEINTQLEIKDEKENIIDIPERPETVIAVPQMAAAAR